MATNRDELKTILGNLDPTQYQEIRDAYYKAMEGLHALAETLEIADAKQPKTAGPLLDEHYLATEALDAMKKSQLGRMV